MYTIPLETAWRLEKENYECGLRSAHHLRLVREAVIETRKGIHPLTRLACLLIAAGERIQSVAEKQVRASSHPA